MLPPGKIAHVRQLHAEQEHLDTIQIGKAVKLEPYLVADILMGHPLDEVLAEDVTAFQDAATRLRTLGEIATEIGLPLGTVNAMNNGLYDHLLPAGWDLV